MSGRSDDDELADLLRDLERDLDRLTDRLDADDEAAVRPRERGSGRRRAPGRRRSSDSVPDPNPRPDRGPRPPSPGDLLRFTEAYTIPTVISVLEAAIQSLELVRGGLRLADPTRRAEDAGGSDGRRDRTRDPPGVRGRVASELGSGASVALDRTLSDLRAALSAADLPEDGDGNGDAREILEDARSLTDEIERRLDEGRSDRARDAGQSADADRSEQTDRDGRGDHDRHLRGSARRGVGIEVRDADDERGGSDAGEAEASADATDDTDDTDDADDPDATDDADDPDATDDADDPDAPQVDVDAELESIRREMDEEREGGRNAGDDADETEGREGDEGGGGGA